jgi:hypothetical protein
MVMFLDKLPPPNAIGSEWLTVVRADRRMVGEDKALAVAGELARYIRHCGSGEMPSPADIARPVKLTEDAAIEGVNQLIARGFVAIVFRPRIRFATLFFCRPGPYQKAMIQKAAGKGAPDANTETRSI